MAILRDYGSVDRYPYLDSLHLNPQDIGRLDVVTGTVTQEGFYVEVSSGESRLLTPGEEVPPGIWVAQLDIDSIEPDRNYDDLDHGFGEGWGSQQEQLGGDRDYIEEDSGGTRRVPHGNLEADTDPYINHPEPA